MRLRALIIGVTLLGIPATGSVVSAQAPKSPAAASESSVWITRIDPPVSVTLTPGTTVHFLIEAEYTLAVPEGQLALYVQGAEIGFGRIASDVKLISQGSGKVSFVIDAKIPSTRRVDVITAVYTSFGESTTITDHRVFEVARSPQK
jgi:hypothetical protein